MYPLGCVLEVVFNCCPTASAWLMCEFLSVYNSVNYLFQYKDVITVIKEYFDNSGAGNVWQRRIRTRQAAQWNCLRRTDQYNLKQIWTKTIQNYIYSRTYDYKIWKKSMDRKTFKNYMHYVGQPTVLSESGGFQLFEIRISCTVNNRMYYNIHRVRSSGLYP